MPRISMSLGVALVAASSLCAGCDDKGAAPTQSPVVKAPPPASAAPEVPSAAPMAPASAAPATSGSASGPAKVFDCGAKGQKMCPMQAWMKNVMAIASSSDDGPALAKAFTYVSGHVPPGYSNWKAMADAAAVKAKAGDVDGARDACKQCHDAYKDDYKRTMRDRPF